MASILVDKLIKRFGEAHAVETLTLAVADGELLVLLGPSGCGKTTTMNCIAGLESPSSGRILFDGTDVTTMPPHRRNVAMVFQASTLYPHLTARQNIAMSLRHAGLTRADIERRVVATATVVDVARQLDKLPGQLSGGERQRVATAKAIVRQPAVFLLDEPLAALDAALRLTLRAELVNLQKRLGTTMILVTHDQSEAMTMGDRIAVMRSGRLEQIDTPDDLYAKPATRFVAGFVGTPPMNLLEGTIEVSGDAMTFVTGGFHLPLPVADTALAGRSVTLGVRPEHLAAVDPGRPEALAATVYAVEHLGRESILVAELAPGLQLRAITAPHARFRIGAPIGLAVTGGTLHLFDAAAPGQPAIARIPA